VNRSPAFERFVTAGLPTTSAVVNWKQGSKLKLSEVVPKNNFDDVVIGRNGKLHFGNDLALSTQSFTTEGHRGTQSRNKDV
jgi:hypothetical protein